jgi:hypothetical protein
MSAGAVPSEIRPILYGASLCALTKKDGSIRSIAVSCTLRCLVVKAACKTVNLRVASLLASKQLVFGVKQGSEAAAHAVRRFAKNLVPGMAMLKLNFLNAFNSIHRDDMMQPVRHTIPELLYFISTCYERSSHLLRVSIVTSSCRMKECNRAIHLALCCFV